MTVIADGNNDPVRSTFKEVVPAYVKVETSGTIFRHLVSGSNLFP